VGHGLRTCLDDVHYKGVNYPIFSSKDVKDVDVKAGLPIMVAIACYTGEFDSKTSDAIGEELLKRRRGPVAFIGGSRVTQPYGNALLGHAFVARIFQKKAATLGEALWGAKAAVLERDDSPLRRQADAVAAMIQLPQSLEPMRKDVVQHYNLLGDPALVVQRPTDDMEIETLGVPRPGGKLVVQGRSAEGPVELTLECARDKFCRPTTLEGEGLEKQLARRYANANNKVIVKTEAAARDGAFEAEIRIPEAIKPGKYYVKSFSPATGGVGSKEIEISE
jgi:hypothetical protein